MTSKWMIRAPASITSSTWAPNLPMSAERTDGSTRGSPISSFICSLTGRSLLSACGRALRRFEHGCPTRLAFHVGGVRHPGDRLVLAAVGALGDEFEAAEAVDAAQTARQLGGPQPRLAAVRAGSPAQRIRLS